MLVEVKGTGQLIEFPDEMSKERIRDILRLKMPASATENASAQLAPLQPIAAPYKPTLSERFGQRISDKLYDSGVISDRYGAQRIGENIGIISEAIPGLGDAAAGDEFGRALAQGDKVGAGLGLLAAIPVFGDAVRYTKRPISKIKNMQQKFIYDREKSLINEDGSIKKSIDRIKSDFEESLTDNEYDLLQNSSWMDSVGLPINEQDSEKVLSKVNKTALYHGSPDTEIDKLDLKSGGALFLTADKSEAKNYATGTGKVYKVNPNIKNPFFVESTDVTMDMESSDVIDELKNQGYDSIVPLDYGNVVILDESAIN